MHSKEPFKSIASGLPALDKITGGLPVGLIVIAARPSQGKTALALNIISHVVLQQKKPVLFLTLEMSKHAIMERLVALEANLGLMDVRTGFFDKKMWSALTAAASRLAEAPLFLYDAQSVSARGVQEVYEKLAALLKTDGKAPALIVIDYLQLMRGAGHSESRYQEISGIVRDLKTLARDLNVPVIVLSMLSRRPKDKDCKDFRPGFSDVSGAEQDSDLIVLVHREAFYREKGNPAPAFEHAELICAKNRRHRTGTALATFDAKVLRFSCNPR